jgi:transcriptional regulator with XRE-family HTH domain
MLDARYVWPYTYGMQVVTPIHLRVKELRDAAGLSQTELAERAGVRRALVSDIERGENTNVKLETLEKLATALGVDAALLIIHTKKGKR